MKKIQKFISLILAAVFVCLNSCPVLAENVIPLKSLNYIFDYGSERTVEDFMPTDEERKLQR